jgi:hypothetical protein
MSRIRNHTYQYFHHNPSSLGTTSTSSCTTVPVDTSAVTMIPRHGIMMISYDAPQPQR